MLHEMAAAIREQAAVAHRMIEQMEQMNEENSKEHNGGAEVDLEYLKFQEGESAEF